MARRKPVEPSPAELDQEPPRRLLRFRPTQQPLHPEGRPIPWRVEWTGEEFTAFLRARAAWRETHAEPLPHLPARERVALHRLELPPALVEAEDHAPKKEQEWQRRGTSGPGQVLGEE